MIDVQSLYQQSGTHLSSDGCGIIDIFLHPPPHPKGQAQIIQHCICIQARIYRLTSNILPQRCIAIAFYSLGYTSDNYSRQNIQAFHPNVNTFHVNGDIVIPDLCLSPGQLTISDASHFR